MLSLLIQHANKIDWPHAGCSSIRNAKDSDGMSQGPVIDMSGSTLEIEAGDRLFREGSRATALYYVVSGTIKAEIGDCFEHRVIGHFKRGDVLGFTYSETMLYTASAVTPAKFYCYPAEMLLKRFARDPKAAERLAKSSVSSLARMLALLAIVRVASPTQRMSAFLVSKLDGEASDLNDATKIEMDISPADLAMLLGMSTAAIDESLEELHAAGVIRRATASTIEIYDFDYLEALSLRQHEHSRIFAGDKPAPETMSLASS